MLSLAAMANALGGEVSGQQVLCPGPGHSARDRSVTVRVTPDSPDGVIVHSHAGDDWRAVKEHVLARLGLDRRAGPRPAAVTAAPRPIKDGNRMALALAIWNEARTPFGFSIEPYLAGRGLALPDDSREVIRFHPSCPFAGARTRAMVALVRDTVTNAPIAIHRTALTAGGSKALVNGKDRLALGPVGGGAVKLTADEDVTTCLGIGEGIETTLSLQRLPEFGRSPVWALIAAGGVAAFPVLSGIETLWIAVDHDPAGLAAADLVANRWRRAGREVFLVKAIAERSDLNDIVRQAQHG